MSSATSGPDLAAPPAHETSTTADGARDGTDAADRGQTRIDPAVVEKVAVQAVREIDNATGSPRRVLGVNLGSPDDDTGAKVTAHVDDDIAVVDVTMTVIYPASVRQVTRQTRQHLRERVKELTGIDVQEVDITVAGMRIARAEPPRVR